MSDAHTDIARDEERRERIVEYLRALKECLEFTGEDSKLMSLRTKVIDAAKACDAVRGTGYWTQETNLAEGLEEKLNGLLARDANVWTDFLTDLRDDYFVKFVKLSPFKDMPGSH